MLEIVFRPKAEEEIEVIAAFTKAEYGERQAKHYVEDIFRQITFAAEFPGIGSEAIGLPTEYRKVRSGMHRVIYRHSGRELIVVRILHASQDVPDEIEDFW
jgi:toxin ParE1/3/4